MEVSYHILSLTVRVKGEGRGGEVGLVLQP